MSKFTADSPYIIPDFSKKIDMYESKGREGYYGWYGVNGSVLQWNPEKKIGFAYIPTTFNPIDISSWVGGHL